jgi:phosphatidylserine decarboxylase
MNNLNFNVDPFIFFNNLKWVIDLVAITVIFIISGLIFKSNLLTLVGIILFAILLYFFRNNLELPPKNNNNFLSPSSSKIINIVEKQEETQIFTFLSVLDRHFMIAPVDCTIKNIEFKTRKHTDAERLRVTFEDSKGRIFVLDQIVSKFAFGSWLIKLIYGSRCVIFKKVGDKLKQGERYGLIRFGSSMQYNLPKDYNVSCRVGKHYELGDQIASLN